MAAFIIMGFAAPHLYQWHQGKRNLRAEAKRVACLPVQRKVLAWRAAKEQRADKKLGE